MAIRVWTNHAQSGDHAWLAIVAFGDVENYNVRVQLWRYIAIDREGGIVLKLGSDELARSLGRMVAADAGLCDSTQGVQQTSLGRLCTLAGSIVNEEKLGK